MSKTPKRPFKVIWLALSLLAIPLLAITILIVNVMLAVSSSGGRLSSGRTVLTNSDSIYCWSTFSSDAATISTGRQEIVVQPTALIVDGTTVANIDEDVAYVQVRVNRGVVSFVADGKTVQTSLR